MGILWIFIASIIFLLIVLRILAIRDANYFESRGLFYVGNVVHQMVQGIFTKKFSFVDRSTWEYAAIKKNNLKFAGSKDFGQIAVTIADLDLLKHILVKDFDHFVDRRSITAPKADVLFRKMLLTQKGDQWKGLRSKMSPTFTTGKIRRMFQIFDKSAEKFVKYVEKEMEKSGEIDLTEGYSKYTMDVIASAVFGVDSKAFEQVEPSLFETMGNKFQLQFGGLKILKFIVIVAFPKLADILGFSFFSDEVQHFFSKVIKSTIKHREETGEKRDDFIQLMLEARAGQLKVEEGELSEFEKKAEVKFKEGESNKVLFDDDCITANCVLFILGGFDTTQSLLIFAAYALALHSEVQDKLREEIKKTLEEDKGKFTYEGIHKMEYMEAFINETLRFYPPAVISDRGCTQDYKIPDSEVTIEKGTVIILPIYGLHHDERYYENPEQFNPERFSSVNRSKINPYAFMPFGQGPRNCIGMRFALTEVKLAIAHLVLNFSIQPSSKTLIPMKFQNMNSLRPEGGMWLALNRLK